MSASASEKKDSTTEEKIKTAAKTVFYKKGFAATRTRDIAEEAGLNLALLNYYFRSKAKLFEIIMAETFSGFIGSMKVILDDEKTSLEQKVITIAERYIDFISIEPEIPTFILTEIRNNPEELLKKLPIKEIVNDSVFIKQFQEAVQNKEITEPNPLHFLMNLLGLVVFPFIVKPIIMGSRNLETEQFDALMQERKKKIPIWINMMFKA
ncbi:TetR/AcrR family transcriptional regulator [Flavobacterium nitrogenifigens]|uniref:Transcriptional regulator, TetR family n=1 Tax=Flavobacterium nitrogenifigens TaxID=1617283 RepID=A0A521DXZ2_9FLAO|nr:TetR family transcriptional regulator [Flavobacterium nitrogenifigens]KAF2333992.1 TetR/AcrR family transcriptional regulator [Flavobacterium nitrogenifigens]SMO76583.1 transcriptional regulator, TetR family [Flavobacterium nitrogenifigens]